MEKRTNTAKFYAPVGYARISTADQSLAPQIDALKAAGCGEIFEDCVSGAKTDRLGLDQALDHLRSGDTLIVWKLDRLGRSMSHLIDTVRDLDQRGIGFKSLTEGIDTTTSGGTLVFHLFGALAQFERDLIRERTRAGLSAAAARGRKGGRKAVVTAEKLKRAKMLIESGLTVREAAARIKVGKTALYDAINADTSRNAPN
ncbi:MULTISPECIES: recombinase family protein [unclassified Sulfitobacter]|uniref:recombinase family protein n=1 Tax=unclassified Sulfitobacter TaxID=196795 RepID=UPI003745EBCA